LDPSGQLGHTGFQIAPSVGKPVYVEYKATLPAADGQIAHWPALWLTGQDWPQDGEIDVMEGFGTSSQYHVRYGTPGDVTTRGGVGGTTAGTHTFGVLWTTVDITFVYDGSVVGSIPVSLTSPMYLIMENSLSYSGANAPSLVPSTMTVRYVRVWQ
jgi:beta-glucanase (GH16 family)